MKKWKYCTALFILAILMSIPVGSAFAANNLQWEIKTNLPDPRAGNAVAEVDGIIYSIGGSDGSTSFNDVNAYNPKTNKWAKMADMPTARSAAAAVVYNEKIYVIGGYSGNYHSWNDGVSLSTVEEYDPKTNSWSRKNNMPIQVGGAAVTVYKDKIYSFGGLNTATRSVADVLVYDPTNDSWDRKNNMSQALHGSGIVNYNDKIYLVAGRYIGPNESVDTFLEYDPLTDTWAEKEKLPQARTLPSTVMFDGKIIAIGGSAPDSESKTAVSYDFKTNTWSPFPSLNEARTGAGAVVLNGKIYVFGGTSNTTANKAVGTVEVFGDDDNTNPEQPTPEPTGERAILVVTMNTGLEKEFDLSMGEVNAFITWYENKQAGSGTASYAINKHNNNKGPFSARKDYVIFDKILTFEVNEYTTK